MRNGGGPARRVVLAAGGLAAVGLVTGSLGGCDLGGLIGSDEPVPGGVADAAPLRALAAESLSLAAGLTAAIVALPDQAARLTPLRDAHREHAAALSRSLDGSAGPTPSGSPAASGGGTSLQALAAAERAAADRAALACVQVASHNAPLVGVIAAARASHAEALS